MSGVAPGAWAADINRTGYGYFFPTAIAVLILWFTES
jgi:hypothetical protein